MDRTLGLIFNLPPAQAVEFLNAKISKESWSWTEVWQNAHEKTFTIAKTLGADVLEDIRTAVEDALANGTPFKEFQKDIEPILKKKGWWGSAITPEGEVVHLGTPWRLETIFRTNILSSYQAGRQDQMNKAISKPNSPFKFKKYVAIRDSRTRPSHALLNGKIFPANDDFWHTHTPPNGYNCRCDVILLTETQYKNLGSPEIEDGKMTKEKVTLNKKTGKTAEVSVYVDKNGVRMATDPGFSNSPNVPLKPDYTKYKEPIKSELKKEIKKAPKAPEPKAPVNVYQEPKNFKEIKSRLNNFISEKGELKLTESTDFKATKDTLKAFEDVYSKYPFLEKLDSIGNHANKFKDASTNAHAHGKKLEFNPKSKIFKKNPDFIYVENEEWISEANESINTLNRTLKSFEDEKELLSNNLKNENIDSSEIYSTKSRIRLLTMNINILKDEVNRYTERLNYNRWSWKQTTEKSAYNTIIHEFGHVIHDQLIGGHNTSLLNLSNNKDKATALKMKSKWIELFKFVKSPESEQIGKRLQKSISQYAFKDEHEFFAENFIMYWNRIEGLDPYIKEFYDVLLTNDSNQWNEFLKSGKFIR